MVMLRIHLSYAVTAEAVVWSVRVLLHGGPQRPGCYIEHVLALFDGSLLVKRLVPEHVMYCTQGNKFGSHFARGCLQTVQISRAVLRAHKGFHLCKESKSYLQGMLLI